MTKEIIGRSGKPLTNGDSIVRLPKVIYRCADRDDGCGHCPRSEPHTHPDEQQGDECYRRGGKVTCERV